MHNILTAFICWMSHPVNRNTIFKQTYRETEPRHTVSARNRITALLGKNSSTPNNLKRTYKTQTRVSETCCPTKTSISDNGTWRVMQNTEIPEQLFKLVQKQSRAFSVVGTSTSNELPLTDIWDDGMWRVMQNTEIRCACHSRAICLLSASFLRHFSLAIAGLAPLSRFLEGALYEYLE